MYKWSWCRFQGILPLVAPGYELVPLPWVAFSPADTVASYAQKMAVNIPEPQAIVLGLSFGGMLTVELARQGRAAKALLVSSASSPDELGPIQPFIHWVINAGILPTSLLTYPFPFLLDRFGAVAHADRQLMKSIIRHSDGRFVKWALKAMFSWERREAPAMVRHVHGTADQIIAPVLVKPDDWIAGGSHIMICDRAAEVSSVLLRYLQQ